MMDIDERAEQKVNDYLEHYGVKGMKWGKHLFKRKVDEETKKKMIEAKQNIDLRKRQKEADEYAKNRMKTLYSGTPSKRKNNREVLSFINERVKSTTNGPGAHNGLLSDDAKKELCKFAEQIIRDSDLSEETIKKVDELVNSGYFLTGYWKQDNTGYFALTFTNPHDESAVGQFKGQRSNQEIELSEEDAKKLGFYIPSMKMHHSALEYEIVDDVLEHHGIEGQKWGIKHGPPYPLDKKTSKSIKNSGKVTINIKNLNDDDLQKIVMRLNLEKQLKELTKEDTKKADTYLKKTLLRLRDTTANIIFKSVETAATAKLTNELKKKMKVNVDPPKDKK